MATTEDPRARADGTAAWKRELYDAKPEREGELSTTISGLENEPLYTPDNVEIEYGRDLGYPGVYPFTRGVYPSMYRGKLWTMRQFAGFGTAEETNARFRYLLEHGQTGLSTAFDMPTLMGYDSDHRRSLGEVGREGVAIDSLEDMETLFSGIPLDQVSTSMTINSPAAMLLAFYVCVGEEQGVRRARARRRRLRAAAFLLLQRAHRLLRGDRQVPRGEADLGERAARALRGEEPALVVDALPHTDGRRLAHRPAAGGEHRPHRPRGHGRRARRHPVVAHELVRRGAGAADRARGAHRSAHAAGDRARVGGGERDRSAGRLLVPRGPDKPARGRGVR